MLPVGWERWESSKGKVKGGWLTCSAALHVFVQGGQGFGMRSVVWSRHRKEGSSQWNKQVTKALWQSGLMRLTRNQFPSGAHVRIMPMS